MLTRFRREERGAMVVEFGLVVPILLLLVFGIIDFGRAYYTLNNLTSAVREGVRRAVVLEDPMSADAQKEIKDVVVNFSQPLSGPPMDPADVIVTMHDGTTPDARIEVQASYEMPLITPLVGQFGPFTLTQRAVFRWERAPDPTAP